MCTVGLLTTWQSNCGIYEYTRHLVCDLLDTTSDITIFGNYGDTKTEPLNDRYSVYGDRVVVVPKCFGVYWWGEPVIFDVNAVYEAAKGLDVFHVQYHSSLYKHPEFTSLIKELKKKVGKLVITLHDSSRNGFTDLNMFDDVIYHKQGILHEKISGNSWLLPYPVQYRRPSVFSFGMGRNDYQLIKYVCDKIGIDFTQHDSREQGWLTEDELRVKMKQSDAIVLWYNEVAVIGASSAARTAISSYRPVIVNNVGWFSDIEEVIKVTTAEELEQTLRTIFKLTFVRENSFKSLAKKHMEIYHK